MYLKIMCYNKPLFSPIPSSFFSIVRVDFELSWLVFFPQPPHSLQLTKNNVKTFGPGIDSNFPVFFRISSPFHYNLF